MIGCNSTDEELEDRHNDWVHQLEEDRDSLRAQIEAIGPVIMYQVGHTDGYTHSYRGPLYKTSHAAQIVGEMQHGPYNVAPMARNCVTLPDGRTFIVEGPYKTADEVALEEEVRKRVLAKLTPAEQKILGIK